MTRRMPNDPVATALRLVREGRAQAAEELAARMSWHDLDALRYHAEAAVNLVDQEKGRRGDDAVVELDPQVLEQIRTEGLS